MQSGKIEVLASINGVLGALVGITAGCCVVNVWDELYKNRSSQKSDSQ